MKTLILAFVLIQIPPAFADDAPTGVGALKNMSITLVEGECPTQDTDETEYSAKMNAEAIALARLGFQFFSMNKLLSGRCAYIYAQLKGEGKVTSTPPPPHAVYFHFYHLPCNEREITWMGFTYAKEKIEAAMAAEAKQKFELIYAETETTYSSCPYLFARKPEPPATPQK